MDLFELQKHIKDKTLPKLLVFYGDEYEIMNLYISEICKRYNLTKLNVDSANSAFVKSKGLSIIKNNCLYISRYEKEFLTTERNWESVDKLNSNYVILIQQKVDSRLKFFKQFKDVCVEFSTQTDEVLKTMLSNKHSLCDGAVARLMKNCSNNYSRCLKELAKIRNLSEYCKCSQDDAYRMLIREKTIQEDFSVEIPDFINSVMTKKPDALALYYKLVANGVSNIVLISWLYNAVKNQILMQGTNKPTMETTGLSYFFYNECKNRLNHYSLKELINLLYLIKSCEQGVKSGIYEQSTVIEYILINCVGGVPCINSVCGVGKN